MTGRLISILPESPQSAWVRYGMTTVMMAICMGLQFAFQNQTGSNGLFLLLPGIFLAGLMFDRGTVLYATALGTLFAYFSTRQLASDVQILTAVTLFAVTGFIVGVVAHALRLEKEKAQRAQDAKTLLLMELAHRTKNNLAMLSAMMRLQARDGATAPQALHDMANRIQVMSHVYDHLTIRTDRKVVDAKEYLTEICQKLSETISGTRPVSIKVDADELYIHSEQAVPIAIIVNELVTNSLKHAFPEGRPGVIQVSLRAADEVVVSVVDNGVGAGGSQETGGSQEEGIGSRITALLAQQLGGTIARDNLGSGSSVTLRMPRPRES